MKLKDSNIKCLFVTTGFPESRSRFYRKVTEGGTDNLDNEKVAEDDNLDDEAEVDGAVPGVGIPEKISGREGYFVESTTVHDRYAARPKPENPDVEGKLERICLAQFATCYTPIQKLPKAVEIDKDGCS